jgi:integrase
MKRAKEKARSSILNDEELRAIWRATGEYRHPFGSMLRFILLTATRRNEANFIKRSEVKRNRMDDTSGEVQDENRPSHSAVNGGVSLIDTGPSNNLGISSQSAEAKSNGFIFTLNGRQAIGGLTRHKQAVDEVSGVMGWTIHDLRRTARSLMSRAGVNADIAERCSGHVIGGVRGIYDRHEYFEEKKRAFELLAGQIDRIMNPQANVLPMRGER